MHELERKVYTWIINPYFISSFLDGEDYIGGSFPLLLGQMAFIENCSQIIIIRDNVFEELEDFIVRLSTSEANVVIGSRNHSDVYIDEFGKLLIY